MSTRVAQLFCIRCEVRNHSRMTWHTADNCVFFKWVSQVKSAPKEHRMEPSRLTYRARILTYPFWWFLNYNFPLFFVQYYSLYRFVRDIHSRDGAWLRLARVQGRACIGRPSDDFILIAQPFTLQIIQFEFRRCFGAAIVFVFGLLQFSTRGYKIPHYSVFSVR